MAEERVLITQNELDRMLTVVSNVQKDNKANERGETPAELPLSQDELDTLFMKDAGDRDAGGSGRQAAASARSKEEAAKIRAQKIAERKAHSARILAQVKANAPRRVLVSYGGCVKNNIEIDGLHSGETIRLDRLISDAVKVYVDGRLFAEGVPGNDAGVATVTLTKIMPQEER